MVPPRLPCDAEQCPTAAAAARRRRSPPRSPLDLTAQLLECQVGEARLDYLKILMQQQIVLTNVPRGSARVVFSPTDFASFLQHPLMQRAAAGAVEVGGRDEQPPASRQLRRQGRLGLLGGMPHPDVSSRARPPPRPWPSGACRGMILRLSPSPCALRPAHPLRRRDWW